MSKRDPGAWSQRAIDTAMESTEALGGQVDWLYMGGSLATERNQIRDPVTLVWHLAV